MANPSASDDQKKPSYQLCRPHLSMKTSSVARALAFYKDAFGAEFVTRPIYSTKRKADATRVLQLAHLKFGAAEFLISEVPEENLTSTADVAATKNVIHVNVAALILHVATDDVQATAAKAKAAGAKELIPPFTESGIHCVVLQDPFGFVWGFANILMRKEYYKDRQQLEVKSTADSKMREATDAEEE